MAPQDREKPLGGEFADDPIPPGPEIPAEDTLEFEKLDRKPRAFSNMKIALIAAAVVGAGAGAWAVMDGSGGGESGVPLIRAEEQAFKSKPENPGGMDVPDRDKLVYDRIASDPSAAEPERLLPQPETPLPPPGGGESAEVSGEPASVEAAEPASLATPEERAAAPSVEQVNATREPPPVPEPPHPRVAASTVLMTGAYRVQLGAVRSEIDAEQEWSRLRKRYPDLLGNLELAVTRADLGDKGVFFRLRAGPIPDQASARKLCDDLTEKKIGCLVVRPGT
jgi:cell division septation protein DedD